MPADHRRGDERAHEGGSVQGRLGCLRDDALGNVAVMLALRVLGTGSAWPDLLVAAVIGVPALPGPWAVVQGAWAELQSAVTHPARRANIRSWARDRTTLHGGDSEFDKG